MSKSQSLAEMKSKYLAYFTDVPIQKYAAMSIARDEDTIIRWRKDDQDFADAIQSAKAEWIRKRLIATKAEFALERLEKEVFSSHRTVGTSSEDTLKFATVVDLSKTDPQH